MFGPQGALPLTTTDEAFAWLRARDDAFPRFVDIFQGRFLALFFRAWADARPIAQNDRPADDRFRDYVGAVIGLGAAWFKNRDSLHDFVKLEYAGLLAPRVKSVSRLRSFLSGLVGSRVEIDEFVGTWLTLDESERSRLGSARSGLGTDCMLGASAFTVSDKFRVRVYARDFAHYRGVSARRRACRPDRRRGVRLCRRRIRLGFGARHSRRRNPGGADGRRRAIGLDGLDGAQLVEDRSTMARRCAISFNQPPRRKGRGAFLKREVPMGADISVESVAGKLNRVGYESLHPGPAAGEGARQSPHRAGALAVASVAEGSRRPRVDRRSFQARSRAHDRGYHARDRRATQERNRDAGHLHPGRRRARPRLALCDLAVRRDANSNGSSAGRRAEVARVAARAHQHLAGIRQNSRRRGGRRPPQHLAAVGGGQSPADGRLRRRGGRDASWRGGAGAEGHHRARPFQPGPHRQGQGRRHGPDSRPRRRDPADHRRADAPPAKQPDPHRRGGRRQDGGG